MPIVGRFRNAMLRGFCLATLALWIGCAQSDAPPAPSARAVVPPAPVSVDPPDKPPSDSREKAEASADGATVENDSQVAEPAEPPPAHFEKLVIFTPSGPMLVHLQILCDGEAQRAVAETILQRASRAGGFKGSVDPTWSAVCERPAIAAGTFGNAAMNDPASRKQAAKKYDANRDNRAQADELANFFAQDQLNGRAFAVRSLDAPDEDSASESSLLSLLDVDGDGRLSAQERALAPQRLHSRDADQDEVLVPADFQAPRPSNAGMSRSNPQTRRRAMELNKLEVDSIYYTLCEMYDTGSGLEAENFAISPRLFRSLDIDSSGSVSQAEIAGLLTAPADVQWTIRYAEPATPIAAKQPSGNETPPREQPVLSDDLLAAGAKVRQTSEGITIELADFELQVIARDLALPARPDAAAEFARLDVDKSGSLAGDELDGLKTLGWDVEVLDKDHDGAISPAEARAALSARRDYRSLQIQARVGQEDDALFSWLDANRDGRLTNREILAAPRRLAELDRHGDGFVAAGDIPRRIACLVERGDGMPARGAARQYVKAEKGTMPAWLAGMDQNADGEVSQREFLGTPAQFQQLDRNDDGYLDAREANGSPNPTPEKQADADTEPTLNAASDRDADVPAAAK